MEKKRYLLPLRDIIVYPKIVTSLFVGRKKSILSVEESMKKNQELVLTTQKKSDVSNPEMNDLHARCVTAKILQLMKLPDGTMKILVEGQKRALIKSLEVTDLHYTANYEVVEDIFGSKEKTEALVRYVTDSFKNYKKLSKKTTSFSLTSIENESDYSIFADNIASNISIKMSSKQEILETEDVIKRLEKLLSIINSEVNILQIEKKIRSKVKRQMERNQREYYLNEQVKAIQNELSSNNSDSGPNSDLEEKIKSTKMTKEVKKKVDSEFAKLKQMNYLSAEASVVRNYLDWVLSIPWVDRKKTNIDLEKSMEILNEDHYGLEEIKERVIEFLAVQRRTKKIKGPVLCFLGPPGVGKTSLGESIARATGREFIKFSLGGVKDEAEIRGHRKTYIGSMPGNIIQSMKKVKSKNPLLLLDEIDKIGSDFRGDPASALLEVLDPAQNNKFNDHYLELDYDLSEVMFITTANSLNIPAPLLDRLEVIRIAGYTEKEKVEIANRCLIKRIKEDHGIKDKELNINTEAITKIIRLYTKEAGVRSLQRTINKIARKSIKTILTSKKVSINIKPDNLKTFLGAPKYIQSTIESKDQIGVITGLAWTEYGGEILTIESVMMPGKGKFTVTGNLKDVMKESISAAMSYVRSRADILGIDSKIFSQKDIHVHVPEGATPKDGPSAGIAMACSIISVLTKSYIPRDIAMTGEITLRGRVLPIGGLKEKMLAALRSNVKKILIPIDNAKDLYKIQDDIKNKIEIITVKSMDEVIEHTIKLKKRVNKQEKKQTIKNIKTKQNSTNLRRENPIS